MEVSAIKAYSVHAESYEQLDDILSNVSCFTRESETAVIVDLDALDEDQIDILHRILKPTEQNPLPQNALLFIWK